MENLYKILIFLNSKPNNKNPMCLMVYYRTLLEQTLYHYIPFQKWHGMSNDTIPNTSGSNSTIENTKHIQHVALAVLLSVVIVIVIIGNTLVILAVLTTRRLRTVTNCFVMSLAIADWLVGISVMPPAVAYTLIGKTQRQTKIANTIKQNQNSFHNKPKMIS